MSIYNPPPVNTSSVGTFSADISSQANGVNKIFSIPPNMSVLSVTGTDAPIVYKPTTDYVISGSSGVTLTLTSAVNAPSLGSTLIVVYTASTS